MLVKNICREELICGNIADSLKDICHLMRDYDIGFIPIKKNDQIVGVITDRDIAIKGIAGNRNNLEDIISTNIIDVDMHADISEALNILKENKVKRLLVKDKGQYIGVISLYDILKSNNDQEIMAMLRDIYSCHHQNDNVDVNTFEL